MTRPSSGDSPIEVSTLRPPATAVALAPLPRCSTIVLISATGRPSSSAVRRETNWCEVPWKPYLRIPNRLARSASMAYVAAASGSVAWKAVSKTATCGASGTSSLATSIPVRFGGLCSGASGISSLIAAVTASSMSVEARNLVPPCTTRCPTAAMSRGSVPRSAAADRSAAAWSAAPPPGSPIRSIVPPRRAAGSARSTSWYFSDDEPQLSTRILVPPALTTAPPLRLPGSR
jgi:hypothetical protein